MADATGLLPITVVITLTGQEPGNEEIQTDVLEELKWDTHVQPNEIGVVVKDGIVTLPV